MNLNVNRLSERAGASFQEKASSKTAAPKRRALGDITNAVGDGDSKGVSQNKRPAVLVKPVAAVPQLMHIAESKEDVEVEERAYMQRAVDDIDGRDMENPLLATEIVNDLYDHLNDTEREFRIDSNFMAKQDFINEKMRCILADWLVRFFHLILL